jgi:glycerol uptake facilitator-like aquaporin
MSVSALLLQHFLSNVCAAQAALNPARALGPAAVFHCYGGIRPAESPCTLIKLCLHNQHSAHKCSVIRHAHTPACAALQPYLQVLLHQTPAMLCAGSIWAFVLGEMLGGACAGLLSWPLCEQAASFVSLAICMPASVVSTVQHVVIGAHAAACHTGSACT